ncbi:c-type cytochrome [Phenylobacterium sp.]|uniref:c-type cytochrome n=1 Tax=Phenylobacterium sp. TaxID=1871053 RepID=UPI00286A2D21|nr:c-type cytochrome [Phenylobacterium sp.]
MAQPPPQPPARDRWSTWAAVTVAGLLAFSVIMGLIVLPVLQAPNAHLDAWTAICRAVGLRPGTPAQPQPLFNAKAAPVSQVRWSPATLRILAAADPRPGAALAGAVCVNCHGEDGASPSADFPHLSGQSAAAIFKQLSDFRSGARVNAQMTPVAAALTDRQLAEVAAYYSSFGTQAFMGVRYDLGDPAISRLAHRGDPARRIPPCESCHARGVGGPPEAPVLTGQHAEYLTRELNLYASGQRQNDVYRRMRDIAQRLTPEERQRLGAFYQGVR